MITKNGIEIRMPDKIVMRRVADLAPYARNARTHSEDQVHQLAASMEKFKSWTNPVLIADDEILAGHGRVLAAELLHLHVVPTIDLSHLNGTERKAYILADNKLALNAGWDLEMLKTELVDLQTAGFDLEITGFSQEELDDLFQIKPAAPENDPDAVPDVPEVPYSVPGDIWICGPHRVMCGDSLNLEHWEALMGKERADMVWTDPPYNVDIGGKNAGLDKVDGGNRSKSGSIKNDKMDDDSFRQFLCDSMLSLYTVMKPGASIYVAHPDREAHNFHHAFRAVGLKFSGCIIWKKNQFVLGMTDYQPMHEPILYGWKPGKAHRWFGGRKQTSIKEMGSDSPFTRQEDGSYAVQIGDQVLIVSGGAEVRELASTVVYHEKPSRSEKHPTTKPVGLIVKMLLNNARRNDIVVDAFTGSGSTMIAAEQTGMAFRGMELDPRFTDVQAQRYYEFTGRVPVHAVSGEPFPVKEDEE